MKGVICIERWRGARAEFQPGREMRLEPQLRTLPAACTAEEDAGFRTPVQHRLAVLNLRRKQHEPFTRFYHRVLFC